MLRYHLIFKGRVQGVGFRFTVERFARAYGITGWVKNNPNGTVEAVLEGRQESLDICLGDIKENFKDYISDYSLQVSKATEEFKQFRITLY